ncbi:hypothetical protein DPMN_188661 [Dreissena polymorpha]|uniref:Uncharacterized protein n=1 Tax=Dreissena polymorpha TaxID=45954 RepID=A0A9D4DRP3_DREPO|nr:hypothetical protein DPMN_188661 [Dreissena polymorpha]
MCRQLAEHRESEREHVADVHGVPAAALLHIAADALNHLPAQHGLSGIRPDNLVVNAVHVALFMVTCLFCEPKWQVGPFEG